MGGMHLFIISRLVSGAGDIKITKDGKVLLSEMVSILFSKSVLISD